jgi:hypothetical protein
VAHPLGELTVEAFWRLAVDGFTMFGNSHIRHFDVVRCECLPLDTPPSSPRRQHFWDCQITQSLVRVFSTNRRMPLLRHQLWLATPPASCMGRVWDVVCMAAVSVIKIDGLLFPLSTQIDPGVLYLLPRLKFLRFFGPAILALPL